MYSDMSDSALTTLRDTLRASLTARLTQPTLAQNGARKAEYQVNLQEIRTELQNVQAEIDRRAGRSMRRPIYITGGMPGQRGAL
jgi:hypothetical protein